MYYTQQVHVQLTRDSFTRVFETDSEKFDASDVEAQKAANAQCAAFVTEITLKFPDAFGVTAIRGINDAPKDHFSEWKSKSGSSATPTKDRG